MKYCSHCGAHVSRRIPVDDDRLRYTCDSCGMIHYENPKMVVGTIPLFESEILLCRRAIEPCRGLWTLPAGYLENGETIEEGARRETEEEAGISPIDMQPYLLLNLPFISQVYFMYLGRITVRHCTPGSESLEVKLFPPAKLPWSELAFTVVRRALEQYCRDCQATIFPFQILDVSSEEGKNCF